MRTRIRVGISGWRYSGWRGKFYPKELPQKRELEYASRQVNSIEINGSFYSLQRPENYQTWFEATPEDFVFSVKASRFLTHMRRLKEADTALANFLASGLLRLCEKLGPILWQLPPNFAYDPARLESFFRALPRTTTAAAALARQHDSKVAGRAWTKAECECRLRHALEVRHPSFANRDFIRLLREQDIALVVADTAGKWPFFEDATSDFVYIRLHGDTELYVSGYTPSALQSWASKIRAWAAGANSRWLQAGYATTEPSSRRPGCIYLLRQRRQSSRPFRRDVPGSDLKARLVERRRAIIVMIL